MKRIVGTVLACLILISTAGCTKNDTTPKATANPTSQPLSQETLSPEEAPSKPVESTTTPEQPSAKPLNTKIENTTGIPLNTFTLDVTLNAKAHKLVVKQSIDYINNTGTELKEIYFNLIPEAFTNDGGGVSMKRITVSDSKSTMEKVKETVYKMKLPSSLAAGDQVTINMEYEVSIPNIKNRFGYQEKVFNLGNFIVTPAVYEEGGWSVEPYVDLGDAFYTDIANYNVKINVPEGYTVAATGSKDETNTYHANNVRDFAFCASDGFEVLSEEYEGITLTVCYSDGIKVTAQRVLDVAKNSLKVYGDTFGKYPYDTLSFVVNGLTGGVNGMEYPTFIMLAPETPIEKIEELGVDMSNKEDVQTYITMIDNAICHEIAHQWFYGIVGNDQISYAWLDEGLCRFCEYLYQEEYPPEYTPSFLGLMKTRFEDEYEFVLKGGVGEEVTDDVFLQESLYYWMENDPMTYGEIYNKGASMIYKMQEQMGKEAFSEAAKEYVATFAYRFVTPDTFKEFWNSKCDFTELFDLYLKAKYTRQAQN